MNIKPNPLKILTAFVAALIATLFGFSSSKALANTKASPSPTIEERLTKVREALKNEEREMLSQSDTVSPVEQNLDFEEEQISQWGNWGNGWNNWGNWGNGQGYSKPK